MDWAILLAGGGGTRFWPLSTPTRPKQLLPLTGSESTAASMVAILSARIPPERILVVTSHALADAFRALPGVPPDNVLAEPRAASTAPALAWGTSEALRRDPDAVVVSVHADWHLPDPEAFGLATTAILEAAPAVDRLLTVGLRPTRPDPGFGYIVPGPPLASGVQAVDRFVEKPVPDVARQLMAQGAHWNSGLFAWTARRFLVEVERWSPELAPHLPLLQAGDITAFYERVTPIAVDHALLERSDRVGVVEATFPWDDVGTWDALFRVRERDCEGNIQVGPVSLLDARDSLAWSDGPTIVAAGVSDLIIVAAHGRVLVVPRERAVDLKSFLARLPPDIQEPA